MANPVTGYWDPAVVGLKEFATVQMNSTLIQYGLAADKPTVADLLGTGVSYFEIDTGLLKRYNTVTVSWQTISSVPLVGLLARIPTPGESRMQYFATDDNGGTLYIYTTSWQKVYNDTNVLTAMSGRFMKLEGENNTEVTSTSVVAGDRVIVSGLSIPVTTPFVIMANIRKSVGHASSCGFGLKINSTVVHEAAPPYYPYGFSTSATDQVESGLLVFFIGPRVTNYFRIGLGLISTSFSGGGSGVGPTGCFGTNEAPNATITSIAIRGISANVLNTHGVDEVKVYSLPIL